MKLIFCPECQDVVRLHSKVRSCECRASHGKYIDPVNAVIGGRAIPLGIANSSLARSLRRQPETGTGEPFTAFVIPKVCPTVSIKDSYKSYETTEEKWKSLTNSSEKEDSSLSSKTSKESEDMLNELGLIFGD